MTKTSLPDLLAEILLEISSYLSYGSHLALRLTCHKLFAKIDDPNRLAKTCFSASLSGPRKKAYSMADLLEIEQWPDYNAAKYMPLESKQPVHQKDFFACHLCLRICSAGKFSNAMMKGNAVNLALVPERKGRSAFAYHAGSLMEDINEEHISSLEVHSERTDLCAVDVVNLSKFHFAPKFRRLRGLVLLAGTLATGNVISRVRVIYRWTAQIGEMFYYKICVESQSYDRWELSLIKDYSDNDIP